jgi:hypothetical protein
MTHFTIGLGGDGRPVSRDFATMTMSEMLHAAVWQRKAVDRLEAVLPGIIRRAADLNPDQNRMVIAVRDTMLRQLYAEQRREELLHAMIRATKPGWVFGVNRDE